MLDTEYRARGADVALGADPDDVREHLIGAGYRRVSGTARVPGEFLWHRQSRTEFLVFLKPAYYPLTMIGLDSGSEKLYLMAISGQSGRFSLTVQGAARLFRDRFGVIDALLIDEGVDVFQQIGEQQPVSMNRRRVRAVIAVCRKV